MGLIPGLGGSPAGGHGNPLQYSCLENPHGQRSLVGYSLQDCKESDMTEATKHTRIQHGTTYEKKSTYLFVHSKTTYLRDSEAKEW